MKTQSLATYEIETPQPISINVAQLIMSQIFVPLLNLVNITLAGASRTRNIKETKAFIIGIIANSR